MRLPVISLLADKLATSSTIARLERMEAEVVERMISHAHEFYSDPYSEYDDERDSRRPVGGDTGKGAYLGPFWSLEQSRNASRQLVGSSPTAIGLIERMSDFVLGRMGLTTTLDMEDEKVSKALLTEWWNWQRRVRWDRKRREALERTLRDGELFLRFFDRGPRKNLAVRFIDPEQVQEIRTAEGDAETVESIMIRQNQAQMMSVPAEDSVFFKIGSDSNEKRGKPWLHQVANDIRRFDAFVEDLALLIHIRTAIAIVRQHKGSPAQIQAFADTKKTGTSTVTDSGSQRQIRRQKIRAGSIIDVGNTEVKYLEPKIDIQKLEGYGHQIALRIAQRTGLPLHLAWMESESSTYAGILVSETPGIRTLDRWQGDVSDCVELPVFTRWLRWRQRWFGLPASVEAILAAVSFEGPRYPRREREKEVKADVILVQGKIMSKRTAAIRDSLDPDREAELIAEEESRETYPEWDDGGAGGGEGPATPPGEGGAGAT